ncbi:MAG: hypothetical protein QOH95_1879 [Gaiellaceae bacterium]|jgi:uncharacterized membrane protein YeaQ/YmgE (transglycosylase-associated protein family)|nr:hypothetical protein [Gaiellaceae bacterium]
MIGAIIGYIIVGLIVGALGRLLHPGRDPIGWVGTILLGIIATVIVGVLLHGAVGTIFSIIIAAIVAALLLVIWGRFQGGRTRTV